MVDRFVPLPIAAEKTGISESELTEIAAAGGIKIVWITTSTLENGQMAVRLEDVERLQITREKFVELYRDRFVGLSDAARLLKTPKTTLARWIKNGTLKTIPIQEALELVKQRPGGQFFDAIYQPKEGHEDQTELILAGEGELLQDGRRPYVLRLADAAYAVAIQNFRQDEASGKTSRIFDQNGDMYRPRQPSKWKRKKKGIDGDQAGKMDVPRIAPVDNQFPTETRDSEQPA